MGRRRSAMPGGQKPQFDFSPTPFGTGWQTLGGAGAKVWTETLENEMRQQMTDWAKNNDGPHPLSQPLPRDTPVKPFAVEDTPMCMPRSDPAVTKIPIQIRDPSFIVPGDPRL